MSQKTFANHLADEEASLSQLLQAGPSTVPRVPTLKSSGSMSKLKRGSTSDGPSGPGAVSQSSSVNVEGRVPTVARAPLDADPLLMVNVPSAPSDEEMQALLSAPPLPYNAARSDPPPPHKPQRQFCEICGYWGPIKCMKCGARVCGLECKGAHDDGRCLKFYA